jgi:hypothetical protein
VSQAIESLRATSYKGGQCSAPDLGLATDAIGIAGEFTLSTPISPRSVSAMRNPIRNRLNRCKHYCDDIPVIVCATLHKTASPKAPPL